MAQAGAFLWANADHIPLSECIPEATDAVF